jgi:cation:H+ antiporter
LLAELFTQFIVSAGVIVLAGIFVTKASDSIAEHTGLGRLLAGSIFLAGATSLPEILIDISAVRKGMADLAVGDLMGSSLANLLILAVADLMHRSSRKIFSRSSAGHALSGAMSISMAAIAAAAILLGQKFPGLEVGPIGIGPLAIAASYVLGLRLIYYDQRLFATEGVQAKSTPGERPKELAKAFSVFALCALAILITAPFLADAAGEIAGITGLGKTFIGTTLVALCTSLPELVSTIASVRMRAFDLAIGNVFGSNSFNMLILAPLDLVHKGPILASVSQSHILTALATILATSVAIMGQLYQAEKRKKFIEPDAFTIIGIVMSALILLYFVGTD